MRKLSNINSTEYPSVVSGKIIEYAEKLKCLNIRTKDALHIACGVYSDSDYLITTDKQLFNLRLDDIRIINPLNFLNEVEE
jgi:predicted nucleic acid-binding protein